MFFSFRRNKSAASGVIWVKGDESMQTIHTAAPQEKDPSDARLESLIARLAQGETAAMGPIYDMTSSAVYAYALTLLKHSFDAEDVLHDCYLRLYEAAGSYRSMGKPMAYLITITRNLCLDRLKERNRQTELSEEAWEHLLRVEDVPDNLQAAEWLQVLKEEEQQIVVLHALTGWKHREIAAFLKLPLATVLSKYARAMKKLRNVIAERNETI